MSTRAGLCLVLLVACSRAPKLPELEPSPPFGDAFEVPSESRWWESEAPCPEGTALRAFDERVTCLDENGAMHGATTEFHEGQRTTHSHYWHGQKHGVEVLFEDGKRASLCDYWGGKRHGICVFVVEDGLVSTTWDEGTGAWLVTDGGRLVGVDLVAKGTSLIGFDLEAPTLHLLAGKKRLSLELRQPLARQP